LISPIDDVLQLLQDEATLDLRSKRLAKYAQITSVAASNIDEQDIFVGLRTSLHYALFDGVPASFPKERLAGVVHLNHATEALAHARVLAEICVERLSGHVVGMLKWSIVDVGWVAVGDGVQEGWNFPSYIVEVIPPVDGISLAVVRIFVGEVVLTTHMK
jgi:hypothetical protein